MRGHIRKRRTWEFIVDVGRHPVTGRRRQKSKGGFATKKEAESALHELIHSMDGGADPFPKRIALADYLARWLDYQRARGIRSRTLQAYEGYIRREVLPVIGALGLSELRPGHVRTVLTRMQERGVSGATIAQVRSVLGSALRQAVEDGLIATNPVSAVKRPRIQRPEPHWPTSAQLRALLEASRETIWEVPILLAALAGDDVDLSVAALPLRQQQPVHGGVDVHLVGQGSARHRCISPRPSCPSTGA